MSTENNLHPISLFKFRSGSENDLDSLDQNYIWFPSCDDLNDPFEGMACIDDTNIESSLYHQFRRKFNENHKAASERHRCDDELDDKNFALKWFNAHVSTWRQKIAIFSASKDYQSPSPKTTHGHVLGSMKAWGHYADGLRGYCIEYNFQQLMESLNPTHPGEIGSSDVEYSEKLRPILSLKAYIEDYLSGDKKISINEIQKAFSTKHENTWMHEQETRLFSVKKGAHKINPSCIRAIYLGEKMPSWKKRSIKACLDAKGLGVDLLEVSIDAFGKEYQLRIRHYND